MTWKQKRQLKRDGLMAVNGSIKFRYIVHLLPQRIMLDAGGMRRTVNPHKVLPIYGDYIVWFINIHKTDVLVSLHWR